MKNLVSLIRLQLHQLPDYDSDSHRRPDLVVARLCQKHLSEATPDRTDTRRLVEAASALECLICLKHLDPARITFAEAYGRKVKLGGGRPVYFGTLQYGSSETRRVVLKCFSRVDVQDDEFWRELQIHAQLRHPNLLSLLGFTEKEGRMCLVLPHKTGGDLHTFIREHAHQPLPLGHQHALLSDIARGLEYLHSHNIIHRDLKPANVLLNAQQTQACLADFGTTRFEGDNMTCLLVGTVSYMAPELFRKPHYSTAVDIYSFAVIAWELHTRQEPWRQLRPPFLKSVEAALKRHERPPLDIASTPQPLRELIERCWRTKPADRPTATEILRRLLPRLGALELPPTTLPQLSTATAEQPESPRPQQPPAARAGSYISRALPRQVVSTPALRTAQTIDVAQSRSVAAANASGVTANSHVISAPLPSREKCSPTRMCPLSTCPALQLSDAQLVHGSIANNSNNNDGPEAIRSRARTGVVASASSPTPCKRTSEAA